MEVGERRGERERQIEQKSGRDRTDRHPARQTDGDRDSIFFADGFKLIGLRTWTPVLPSHHFPNGGTRNPIRL